MSLRLPGALCALLLLAGCAQQALAPAAQAPVPAPPSDPLRCVTRAECTTKVSRTLLFVFDYAAAGGALVQRDGRLLFTPPEAPRSEWPAIRIQLAEPSGGAFAFSAECQLQNCRYSAEQLLQSYRGYLDGAPCSLLTEAVSGTCPSAASR